MAERSLSAARTLTVAVTGHLFDQLPPRERPRIKREVALCLAACEAAARKAAGARVRCVLRSAIAEGADRYAADAALKRRWRLVTVLPFPPQRYLKDFPDAESRAHFQDLLDASTRVVQIDRAGKPYAAVGRKLADKADVLVCVWNGRPPKGPGGTSEVAALMLKGGGVVLWISTGKAGVRLVEPDAPARAGSFRRKLRDLLARRFACVERPPEMRVA